MQIEDGQGNGYRVGVNSSNRLKVNASVVSIVEQINEEDGRVWAAPLVAIAPSGATYFFLFQNKGQRVLAVQKIILASTVAGVFLIRKISGTAANGTDLVPTNMNLAATGQPDTSVIQTGTSITGLTEEGILFPIYLAANVPFTSEIGPKIYVPPGTGIAIKAPGAATVNGWVEFYEES